MMHSDILFHVLILMVAFMYASVGHGGASGYLALMAFFSFSPDTMRPTALMLNILVSLVAFVQYYRSGFYKWNLFLPFAITSIPAAFIGGLVTVDAGVYRYILAVLLLFPILKLAGMHIEVKQSTRELNIYVALLIGAAIGLFSGIIGIGGGIILSPVILLLHLADMKHTAAASALFIFVNSISGLAGVFMNDLHFTSVMGSMILVAFAGGLAGSYYGAEKYDSVLLQRMLAVVLFVASVKLILT